MLFERLAAAVQRSGGGAVAADVAGGVRESEVTDRNQSATPDPGSDTGQVAHPPANTAP